MTTHAVRAVALALSASAVAAVLTAVAAPASASPAVTASPAITAAGAAPAARAGAPGLVWGACAHAGAPADQECARLPVPLDYRDPGGRWLSLAVSRVRADRPGARRGTLLLIPGGPGTSGVQMLTKKHQALQKELSGSYDLVSLDPRGVGGSTTASCGLAEEDRHLVTLRSYPSPDGSIDGNVARSRRVAEACDRNGGAVLRSFSTANEVRDIDRLRQALGEERLSAWGVSYGTYVGAVYAQTFPHRTDRWVLDSSGDPDPARVARGWLANVAAGTEDRFPDFAAWASAPSTPPALRLAGRPEEVRPAFLALAARLDREPRESTTPGVPLTGNRLRQALQTALHSDDRFPALAALIRAAQDPAGKPVLTPETAGPLTDEQAAVTAAVVCNDVRWPSSVPAHRRAVAEDRTRHPLTAGMPVNITPCSFWKHAPADRPTRISDRGPSNVLMIQNRRDPYTPHSGALRMRAALGDRARLVTVERGGHGAYLGSGDACGDAAVTGFLLTGARPAEDTVCPAPTPAGTR
ncbi:alpha/beta hydrolase [Streptomyces lavendulocolor]|uniref:alpha/beta hydrolase n=1 Tax=Streptomyces lavendulocolor TaxID=67316 RepID=UPI003C2B5DFC